MFLARKECLLSNILMNLILHRLKSRIPQIGMQNESLEIGPFVNSIRMSYDIATVGDGHSKLPKTLLTTMLADYSIGDFTNNYESSIEKIGFNLHHGSFKNNLAQPQVHVGITAVPQLNPATENTKFQTSAAYFDINCSMTIGINWGSDRMHADPWATYKEGLSMIDKPKYVSGATFAGWNNDGQGSLSSQVTQTNRPGPSMKNHAVPLYEDDNSSIVSCSSNESLSKKIKNKMYIK